MLIPDRPIERKQAQENNFYFQTDHRQQQLSNKRSLQPFFRSSLPRLRDMQYLSGSLDFWRYLFIKEKVANP